MFGYPAEDLIVINCHQYSYFWQSVRT